MRDPEDIPDHPKQLLYWLTGVSLAVFIVVASLYIPPLGLLLLGVGIPIALTLSAIWLSIVIHELGHAISTWLMGDRITVFVIGRGRPLIQFRWLGTLWVQRADIFSGGYVIALHRLKGYNWRNAICILGGPLATLAFLIFCVWLFQQDQVVGWRTPIALTAIFNFYLLIMALILTSNGSQDGNDGFLLWRIYSRTTREVEEERSGAWLTQFGKMNTQGQFVNTAPTSELLPEDILEEMTPHQAMGMLWHACQNHQKAAEHYLQSILLKEKEGGAPSELELDSYLTCQLVLGAFLEKDNALNDRLSSMLLDMEPESATLQGTRGAVLVEIGRLEEGIAMLEHVLEITESPFDQIISSTMLALAEHRLQHTEAAQNWLAQAQSFDPGEVQSILDRVEKEMAVKLTFGTH